MYLRFIRGPVVPCPTQAEEKTWLRQQIKASLKKFLDTGELRRKQKREKSDHHQLQACVAKVTKQLQSMLANTKGCTAPQGVILYLEGLNCAKKASTGGLIQQALDDAGYRVEKKHYNRPPTENEKSQPWMSRFKLPDTLPAPTDGGESGGMDGDGKSNENGCTEHNHVAVVWNSGPAGSFVYDSLAEASDEEKSDRYREFKEFDHRCFKNNILVMKLYVVTTRDAIARRMGKHLGKEKVMQDLKAWLKASYGDQKAEDVMARLDLKIVKNDREDFEAYNMYQSNLHTFTDFALNTDSDHNPWIVVDTANEVAAGEDVLQVFSTRLNAYAFVKSHETPRPSWYTAFCCPFAEAVPADEYEAFGMAAFRGTMKVKRRMNLVAVIAFSGMLVYLYLFWMH